MAFVEQTSCTSGGALVILSGGQDSTTCLFWAMRKFKSVRAVTFEYGQRHIVEVESARHMAKVAGVEHEVIDLGPIFAGTSTLTGAPDVMRQEESELPATFVPGRNILFLAVAASRAYVHQLDTLVVGVSQQDYAGYPDCREDFIRGMESAVSSGLDRPIKIEAPLMHLSKKQTVDLAVRLPGCLAALAYSTTCYLGAVPPCMTCNACILRAKGFDAAGIPDPLIERLSCHSSAAPAKALSALPGSSEVAGDAG